MLRFMGSQIVRHDWVTELNWTENSLIHGPNIPGFYAILLFTAFDLASITSHIHNWVCFCFASISSFFLELFLHWYPVLYWAPTDLQSSSSVSYSLPFHTVHAVLKAGILKWFAFSFSSGPDFVRTLHHDPFVLVGPHGMAHSFIKLDKAVVHVIRLATFLCLWFLDCLPTDGEGLEHFLCCRLFQCEYQESISDS